MTIAEKLACVETQGTYDYRSIRRMVPHSLVTGPFYASGPIDQY